MTSSEDYWNKKIIEWESTYYDNSSNTKKTFLELIAGHFRKPLLIRKQNLFNLIKNEISQNDIICEFGCGSGDFIKDLSSKFETKVSFIGIDISDNAINFAKKKYEDFKFFHSDVSSLDPFPEANMYFGIGFIDYLTIDEIVSLINNIENKNGKYVFSVPEKKINIINILHHIYLNLAGCPKFYKFDKLTFKNRIENCNFIELNNQLFIKNF